jgi:hypothetical protein
VTTIIKRRQAAYQTPERVIFDLVWRAVGQEGISREKIVRGYASEVYLVDTRQGGSIREKTYANAAMRA